MMYSEQAVVSIEQKDLRDACAAGHPGATLDDWNIPRVNRLAEPKGLTHTTPRVCAFCRWFVMGSTGTSWCVRPDGPDFDSGDGLHYETVCDRYEKPQKEVK